MFIPSINKTKTLLFGNVKKVFISYDNVMVHMKDPGYIIYDELRAKKVEWYLSLIIQINFCIADNMRRGR